MIIKVKPSILQGNISVPPSKSYTHRAIILGSLCEGTSKIINPLLSQDTIATINACRFFGVSITQNNEIIIKGKLPLKVPDDVINVENSGTTLRLMSSVAALTSKGFSILTGDKSIRQRPMQPLLDTLQTLGVKCWSLRLNGFAPLIIEGGGICGGSSSILGSISSQFISSLLISTPLANQETSIKIQGAIVSRPYIDATLKIIERFGGKINENGLGSFKITPLQKYNPISFKVPGDFSSASFILAGGALTQGDISITGLDFSLPQGDAAIIDILKKMGVNVSVDLENGIVGIKGAEHLNGGEFNLSDTPDLLPVVALLACKCQDEVIISGVKHARFKETDRISVLVEELPKLGVSVIEKEDGLTIIGTEKLKQCTLNTHGDHRMALAFTIAGMISANGCLIDGFESVAVSYPGFKEDIHLLGGKLEPVDN